MARRPLNQCMDCGRTWQPRGSNRSLYCPDKRCGSENVQVVLRRSGGIPVVLALAVIFGFAWWLYSVVVNAVDNPTPKSTPKTPSHRSTKTGGANGSESADGIEAASQVVSEEDRAAAEHLAQLEHYLNFAKNFAENGVTDKALENFYAAEEFANTAYERELVETIRREHFQD